jgi:hypoxanthine phosphoribosyltransferase
MAFQTRDEAQDKVSKKLDRVLNKKKKQVPLSQESWDDLNSLVDELCEKIPFETPLVDSVCGIARGGLIPAVMVSHKMGLPYTDVIGKNTLVIDDIADTGLTLEKAPGVYTAVLHYKPHTSCFKPNVWAQEHTSDEWVIYPWEKKDSAQIQDYLVSSK